jgi:hypothetical protein
MTRRYCHFVTNPDTKIQKIKLFCDKTTLQNFWYDMKIFAIKISTFMQNTNIQYIKNKSGRFCQRFSIPMAQGLPYLGREFFKIVKQKKT